LFATNPIHLLVVVALINGAAAAPFLVLVMLISADRTIMGEHVNGKLATALGWTAFAFMAVAAVTVIAQYCGL
jgi:Mn2+/Fe2+ NRAMP family transporter